MYTPSAAHPAPAMKSKVIDDTATYNGNWSLIQVQEETVIQTLVAPLKENDAAIEGVTLPAGYLINGPVTSIKLTSGSVEAHEVY
jgi:hypothetical protein